MRRAVILDYGAGNLHSLAKAIEADQFDVRVCDNVRDALAGDVLVLPGVGNFGAAMAALGAVRTEMRAAIGAGHPTLGICLGMQLLFERSAEATGEGIGALAGEVRQLRSPRIPQIGWNAVEGVGTSTVFDVLEDVYYANSFVCAPEDEDVVAAWSEHDGDRFPAAVRFARTIGVQFHPEKSSQAGVRFLRRALAEIST